MEAADDVAKELNSRKKVVRENVMQTLLYYKSEKYTQLVQEALKEKKNASLMEKFAPLLGDEDIEGVSGSIESFCTRILTPQKEMHSCNGSDLNHKFVFVTLIQLPIQRFH